MKIDWRAVLRDALGVLLLGSLGALLGGVLGGGANPDLQTALVMALMIAGFCVSGCLAKQARFKHLALVATGVWLIGSIVKAPSAEAPFIWVLAAIAWVFAAMLLGGLISLAIVKPPPAAPPPV